MARRPFPEDGGHVDRGRGPIFWKIRNTIRLWAERYGIGRKIGGDWHISRVALRIFLDGDMAALAAYHAGDRTNPLLQPYFERAGCGALLHPSAGEMAAGCLGTGPSVRQESK